MKFAIFSFILGLLFVSVPSFAQDVRGTKDQAVAIVQQVVADYKAQGSAAVIKAINEDHKYQNLDLYPFIFDFDGNTVAHGMKPDLVGKNLKVMRDGLTDGKFFIREMIDLAKSGKSGWVDYKWPDPETKLIHPKSSYIERLDDHSLVGVGVYIDTK